VLKGVGPDEGEDAEGGAHSGAESGYEYVGIDDDAWGHTVPHMIPHEPLRR
jgi:hypothetical protein